MRTTLDIDDELLRLAQAQFPAGTSKTVVFEEGLRRLIGTPAPSAAAVAGDARLAKLVAEGRLRPATASVPPPAPGSGVPLARLLSDLGADRDDR